MADSPEGAVPGLAATGIWGLFCTQKSSGSVRAPNLLQLSFRVNPCQTHSRALGGPIGLSVAGGPSQALGPSGVAGKYLPHSLNRILRRFRAVINGRKPETPQSLPRFGLGLLAHLPFVPDMEHISHFRQGGFREQDDTGILPDL